MTNIVILAAGKGARMRSKSPKVLQQILNKPMIHYLLDSVIASQINDKPIIIVSPNNEKEMRAGLKKYNCKFAVQKKQMGTGDAVASVFKDSVRLENHIMVLMGDNSSFSPKTLKLLEHEHEVGFSPITIATTKVPNYKGIYKRFYYYGRIKRDSQNKIVGIIEKNDATPEETKIKEVNPAFYIFNTGWLRNNINKIKMNKAKKEYYLTDIIAIAIKQGHKISSININPKECFGVNTQEELEEIESLMNA